MEIWNGLTDGQGTVIASIITVFAAIIGVLLGSLLFGNLVNDLKGALERSKVAIDNHAKDVEKKLASLVDRIAEIERNTLTTVERVATLDEGEAEEPATPPSGSKGSNPLRETIKKDWFSIRDKLEHQLRSPNIDGRIRGRYARMDRRQFEKIIEAFHDEFGLPQITRYRRANEIWQKYRSGRAIPSKKEADEMSNLRFAIVGDLTPA